MSSKAHMLLVDDDEGDIQLIKECMKEISIDVNLSAVNDGEQCMKFLRKEGEYQNVRKPDVVFLDLNMPRKDGRQTLQEIREDESLRFLPVIILTTSEAEQDITESYRRGANCYIKKPVDFDEYKEIFEVLAKHWFTIVTLPQKSIG